MRQCARQRVCMRGAHARLLRAVARNMCAAWRRRHSFSGVERATCNARVMLTPRL